jgi:uncharacterized protein (DUF849 family)
MIGAAATPLAPLCRPEWPPDGMKESLMNHEVIITCAVSGDYQKSQNPNIPTTAEEQAQEAANVLAAGASIIHIHGREAHDSTITSSDPQRYFQINGMMRTKAPDIIIDNTQTASPLEVEAGISRLRPPTGSAGAASGRAKSGAFRNRP